MYNNYNNNPYNAPYLNNAYGNAYGNNYGYYNQNQQVQTQAQPSFLPLTYVSGIEGAKAYIMQPNSTVYLRDSDSNLLYVKSSDVNGKYSMKTYELVEMVENGSNLSVKQPPKVFASLDDLDALEKKIDSKLEKLKNVEVKENE